MKVLALALLFAILLMPSHTSAVSTNSDCAETWERYVAWLINDYRAENGLNRLAISDTLSASSEHMVQNMSHYNYFGHYTANGTPFGVNMVNHGYPQWPWKGQIIAGGQASPSAVVAAWKTSPAHNAVMLDPEAKVIGVGYTKMAGSTYYRYWAADFGGVVDSQANYC